MTALLEKLSINLHSNAECQYISRKRILAVRFVQHRERCFSLSGMIGVVIEVSYHQRERTMIDREHANKNDFSTALALMQGIPGLPYLMKPRQKSYQTLFLTFFSLFFILSVSLSSFLVPPLTSYHSWFMVGQTASFRQ